jgi:hypothetical protein
MNGFTEPKAGPINDAKQYADALHEIMQNKMPSEQMNAVKMLIENTTSEALQAIIDNMSEEDLINFMSLQRHIIDGTFEKIKNITKEDNKEDNKGLINGLLESILYMPGPNELIANIKEKEKEVKSCFSNLKQECQKTLNPIYDFTQNTFDNISYFVNTLADARYIDDDIKTNIMTKLYYHKGELLVSYENGELKFENSLDNIASEYIRKKTGLEQGKTLSAPPKNAMENSLKSGLDVTIPKTQEAPKRLESAQFMLARDKAQEKAVSIYGKLIPTQVSRNYITNNPVKEEKENKKRKREEGEEGEEGEEPKTKTKKGGKTRRKIRRNKKAKTKKRKTNKKTKKRKANKKTKVNRKKSKKRRTKK